MGLIPYVGHPKAEQYLERAARVTPEPKAVNNNVKRKRDWIFLTGEPLILLFKNRGRTIYESPAGPPKPNPYLMGKYIRDQICRMRGISLDEIRGERKTRRLFIPRQEICYRVYANTGLSWTQIGRLINRDHTTVIHSVRRYEQRLATGE